MLKDGELKSEEFMNDAILAYQGMVLRVALNQTRNMVDAEDVVQDVFIKLMKTRASFRDEGHLRAWLLRVAVNQCRDLSRKAWNRHVDVVPNPVEAVVDVEDDGFSEVADHPIWRAMERMAKADRLVLHLRYVEELSASEIADALSCSRVSVWVRLHRARERLRGLLTEDSKASGEEATTLIREPEEST